MAKLRLPDLMWHQGRMTQKKLAELTSIRLGTVGKLYRNEWQRLSREHIDKLCKIFGCQPSDLFEREEPPV